MALVVVRRTVKSQQRAVGLCASVPAWAYSCLCTCCWLSKVGHFFFFKVERCGKIVTLDTAGRCCLHWPAQPCVCALCRRGVVAGGCWSLFPGQGESDRPHWWGSSAQAQPSLCVLSVPDLCVCPACVCSCIQNEQVSLGRGKHIL